MQYFSISRAFFGLRADRSRFGNGTRVSLRQPAAKEAGHYWQRATWSREINGWEVSHYWHFIPTSECGDPRPGTEQSSAHSHFSLPVLVIHSAFAYF